MDEIKRSETLWQGKSRNILYLSYDGMTDPLGQSQVLPYLIGLTKEGCTFHIVSFEKQHRFETHKEHIQEVCNANGIIWHPTSYTQKSPLITTIWDVYRMKKMARKLHLVHNFHIVHCRSYIAAIVGLALKKKFGIKFIFDMRGFWADERIDGGLWNLRNPIFRVVYSYFKKKELQFFKSSDYTISLTKKGKEEIESWQALHQCPPKIQIIPCCVDLALFDSTKVDEQEKSKLKADLKIREGDHVMGYVGSIGTWYMLPEMLDYFVLLKQHNSSAKFLFVTSENPEKINKIAHQKGISLADIIVTSCLHKDVPLNISLFDTSLFFIRPTFSKKASSPTKQGEIMAMGIPLVCNAGIGDTDSIVVKYQAGYVIQEFSNEHYLKAIKEPFFANYHTMRQGAEEVFSLQMGIEKYLEVYQKLYADEK
jgi:glycosyltransferase involved in cell wall biosynthesis